LLLGIKHDQLPNGGRIILMEKREGYYDYMTRRLREDTSKMSLIEKDMAGLTESHYNVLKHLKDVTQYNLELIKKIERLGGDPKQMEMDV
tara:strand:+ start:35 stop:304 length:270 start_codon:yes stop_codon:yes gene_type:complete